MSKLFYKAMIEDVQNEKRTDAEPEALIDAYAYSLKSITITLARKAWFELRDFRNAKKQGIGRFTLMIERKEVLGQVQWHGVFEYGRKT